MREEQRVSVKTEPGQSLVQEELGDMVNSMIGINIDTMQADIEEADRLFDQSVSIDQKPRPAMKSSTLVKTNDGQSVRESVETEVFRQQSKGLSQSQRQDSRTT